MKILSIDPGLVNLGTCLFKTENKRIRYARAKTYRVCAATEPNIFNKFAAFILKRVKLFSNLDLMIIEMQAKKFKVRNMKVQYFFQSWCAINNIKCIIVSSKTKFAGLGIEFSKNYAKRKQNVSKWVIKNHLTAKGGSEIKDNKNDDFADAFAQGLSYIYKHKLAVQTNDIELILK
jgi:Holliday junction resolvasome RuvABC endonuclease subunit